MLWQQQYRKQSFKHINSVFVISVCFASLEFLFLKPTLHESAELMKKLLLGVSNLQIELIKPFIFKIFINKSYDILCNIAYNI